MASSSGSLAQLPCREGGILNILLEYVGSAVAGPHGGSPQPEVSYVFPKRSWTQTVTLSTVLSR